jgi:hypothetical protein
MAAHIWKIYDFKIEVIIYRQSRDISPKMILI